MRLGARVMNLYNDFRVCHQAAPYREEGIYWCGSPGIAQKIEAEESHITFIEDKEEENND